MDLSKLPKLSDSRAAGGEPGLPPADDTATGLRATALPTTAGDYASPGPGTPAPHSLADTWLSIGVGLFVLLFWPRFLQWASSRLFHTHFDEFRDPESGAVVPYHSVPEFWSDLGPTLLGIVLVVDGLLLFTRRPMLILLALGLTAASTLFNLGWVIYSFGTYGIAPLSFLAVIFGGFIMATQWSSYRTATGGRRRTIEGQGA